MIGLLPSHVLHGDGVQRQPHEGQAAAGQEAEGREHRVVDGKAWEDNQSQDNVETGVNSFEYDSRT